jgi:hypothetical protein
MIYIEPSKNGYHAFQIFDECDDAGKCDTSLCADITRAELVAAIEAIDLHSNVVMPDECDADPDTDEGIQYL